MLLKFCSPFRNVNARWKICIHRCFAIKIFNFRIVQTSLRFNLFWKWLMLEITIYLKWNNVFSSHLIKLWFKWHTFLVVSLWYERQQCVEENLFNWAKMMQISVFTGKKYCLFVSFRSKLLRKLKVLNMYEQEQSKRIVTLNL